MEFELIQNVDEWKSISQQWNKLVENSLTNVPFVRFEYLYQWWLTMGGGEWKDARLELIIGSENGEMIGIAPFFFTTNLSQQPALMLLGSIEISDYLDLIVSPGREDEFILGLLKFCRSLANPAWKVIDLYNLLSNSPTIPAITSAAEKLGWRIEHQDLQHAPFISLPGTWDEYLASLDKKQRHEIRRKLRRLEESEVTINLNIISDLDGAPEASEAFLDLMANDPAKNTFLTAPMREQMDDVIHCAAEVGCLQLAFLEIDGKKAAAYLSFDYLQRLWVYNSGMDRSFTEYSPGWVLVARLIQWAIEHGYKEFDFLRGDEDYKYRFGATDRKVVRVTLTPGD